MCGGASGPNPAALHRNIANWEGRIGLAKKTMKVGLFSFVSFFFFWSCPHWRHQQSKAPVRAKVSHLPVHKGRPRPCHLALNRRPPQRSIAELFHTLMPALSCDVLGIDSSISEQNLRTGLANDLHAYTAEPFVVRGPLAGGSGPRSQRALRRGGSVLL